MSVNYKKFYHTIYIHNDAHPVIGLPPSEEGVSQCTVQLVSATSDTVGAEGHSGTSMKVVIKDTFGGKELQCRMNIIFILK